MERARRLRPAWTVEQQGALARALQHASNDGAAVAMVPLMLGVAQRAERGEERWYRQWNTCPYRIRFPIVIVVGTIFDESLRPFKHIIYCTRNRVERLINQLTPFRRIATRYEKCANY